MPAYVETDFCKAEQGVKYVFAKMGIIYGAMFRTHWGDMDKQSVIDTWADILGRYATYRPSMDFALKQMDTKFIPSAIAFRDLCSEAGRIPDKPNTLIEKQLTTEEKIALARAKGEAMAQWNKFLGKAVV